MRCRRKRSAKAAGMPPRWEGGGDQPLERFKAVKQACEADLWPDMHARRCRGPDGDQKEVTCNRRLMTVGSANGQGKA